MRHTMVRAAMCPTIALLRGMGLETGLAPQGASLVGVVPSIEPMCASAVRGEVAAG